MGVNELCDQCRRLVTEKWTLVGESSPVDEELRDGKSYWILEDVWDLKAETNGHHPHTNGNVNGNSKVEKPEVFQPFIHHSLSELASNRDVNCHLCRWIVDSLPSSVDKYSAEEKDLIFAIPFLGNESIIDPTAKTLAFYYFLDGDDSGESSFAIFLHMRPLEGHQRKISDAITKREFLQLGPKSVSTIDLSNPVRRQTVQALSQWCNECVKDHEKCGALGKQLIKGEKSTLPTRLIGVFEENGKAVIRLCEAQDLPRSVRYATLSHCWGSNSRLELLQSNFEQLKSFINPAALPRLFVDALRVALELSLTYIWVDALCIIQDSPDDWAFECTRMPAVYSQSYVNIAATAMLNSDESLFCQKNELLANALVLDTDWPGSPLDSKRWLCFDEARWNRYVEEAPLNKRAWVLQERMLAPRTVHFAMDQVWWTCKTTQACESLPKGLPSQATRDLAESLSKSGWTTIVEKFTSSSLTYPHDKLAAVSGMAQAYRHFKGYPRKEYVAGLWEQEFDTLLLWQTTGKSHISPDYIAPSWSWASVDGAVEWDAQALTKKRIWFAWGLRSSLDSRYDDPYGPVAQASLRADCMIYSVVIEASNVYRSNVKHNYAHLRSSTYDPRHADTVANHAKPSGLNGLVDFFPNDSRFFDITPQLHAYFLPLCVIDTNHLDDGSHPVVSGLLIEPVEGQKGVYQRLGKVDISYFNSPNVWVLYRNWMVGDQLGPDLFVKDHGSRRYDIVII